MTIEVSTEGINKAGEELLNCSKELSNLFDDLIEITNSISSNITGSTEVEQIIGELNKAISTKDIIISKINKFGNYLINTVVPEYNSFINSLGSLLEGTNLIDNLKELLNEKTEL